MDLILDSLNKQTTTKHPELSLVMLDPRSEVQVMRDQWVVLLPYHIQTEITTIWEQQIIGHKGIISKKCVWSTLTFCVCWDAIQIDSPTSRNIVVAISLLEEIFIQQIAITMQSI